jgi:hypothetical protein
MPWERVSETQRIETIREHRDSPWSPSQVKRQPGFDKSQLFHPSTLGSGQARNLRHALGGFEALARNWPLPAMYCAIPRNHLPTAQRSIQDPRGGVLWRRM